MEVIKILELKLVTNSTKDYIRVADSAWTRPINIQSVEIILKIPVWVLFLPIQASRNIALRSCFDSQPIKSFAKFGFAQASVTSPGTSGSKFIRN